MPGRSNGEGSFPILKIQAISAATGTSKKTINETIAGETYFSAELNIE